MECRIFTEPQMGATYDDLFAVARIAEEAGFDAFFRSDHLMGFDPSGGYPGSTDAWVTLAGLARDTSRIRLGTLVTPITFRLPGLLAIQVAQVDQMSGGRVELGLGAGWFEAEHEAYGIHFPDTRERFDLLEEQLAVISGLWATEPGDRFDHAGPAYPVSSSPALPKPVQRPGPPIIVGGGGPRRTPMLAARYAAEYNLGFSSPERLSEQADRVRRACEQIGRDPSAVVISVAHTVCCGESEAELGRRAGAIGSSPDQLRAGAIAGTPAEVLDRIDQYRIAGAQRVYLQVLDLSDHDHIRLLGDRVVDQLRD